MSNLPRNKQSERASVGRQGIRSHSNTATSVLENNYKIIQGLPLRPNTGRIVECSERAHGADCICRTL